MKISSLIFGALALICLGRPALAVPPVNDNFAAATVPILGVPSISTTVEATVEAGEPGHRRFGVLPMRTVWYRYTPDFNGYMQADTTGSAGDTSMAVYRGTALTKLTLVAKNDDNEGSSRAKLRLAVTKGIPYYFVVDTFAERDIEFLLTPLVQFQSVSFEAALAVSVDFQDPTMEDYGKVIFTLTDKGAVSGKLVMGTKTYPFVSAVSPSLAVSISVPRLGQLPVNVLMQLEVTGNGSLKPQAGLLGSVGDKSVVTFAYLAPVFTKAAPCPRTGVYNYVMDDDAGFGYSICKLTISPTGLCTGKGWLGEGTPFVFSTRLLNDSNGPDQALTNNGSFCHHAFIGGTKCQLTATASLLSSFNIISGRVETVVSGKADFFRQPAAKVGAKYLPLGCESHAMRLGGRDYFVPPVGNRVDAAFNGNAGAVSGNAQSDGVNIPTNLTLTTDNLLVPLGLNLTRYFLKVDVKTGLVTGTADGLDLMMPNGVTNKNIYPVRGMLIPSRSGAGFAPGFYGHLIGPKDAGPFTLFPAP